jgi:hypothetical protein
MYEREITIRGGFPLRVSYRICPAEPDVGIMGPYVEIDAIRTTRGQSAEFLKFTDADIVEIEEQCDFEPTCPDDDWRY